MSALSDHIEQLKAERIWLDEVLPSARAAQYRHLKRLANQNEREYMDLIVILETAQGNPLSQDSLYNAWHRKQFKNGR